MILVFLNIEKSQLAKLGPRNRPRASVPNVLGGGAISAEVPCAKQPKVTREVAVVPMEAAAFIMLQDQLEQILHNLTPREQKIIQLRFGLMDGHPRTLEEVGKEFGVTRERIRQIESKTLSKLRHPSRAQMLKEYLG